MGGRGVPKELLAQLHPLEVRVLPHLESKTLSSLAKRAKLSTVETMRALQWLENKGVVKLKRIVKKQVLLDENAKKAVKEGMPEMRFLHAVQAGAKTKDAIMKRARLTPTEYGASVGLLKGKQLIKIQDGRILPTPLGKRIDTNKSSELSFLKRLARKAKITERDAPLIKAPVEKSVPHRERTAGPSNPSD